MVRLEQGNLLSDLLVYPNKGIKGGHEIGGSLEGRFERYEHYVKDMCLCREE